MTGFALGQYYPGQSLLHRLDPRAKMISSVLFIVCTFLCKNADAYLLLLAVTLLLLAVSTIPLRIVWRGIKPVIFILLFTVIINVFFTNGDVLLVSWRFIHIYKEGLSNAVYMGIRILVLIVGTCLFLTYTTTPIALTDAIEQLLKPLKVLRFPVHEFAMMMTIALRFIPTLMEETQKIMAAQKARGADFSQGNLFHRAKALVPVLVPLFVSSFRRADELATAMECRCYHGDKGRTRMNALHWHAADFIFMLFICAVGAGVILLNRFSVIGIG